MLSQSLSNWTAQSTNRLVCLANRSLTVQHLIHVGRKRERERQEEHVSVALRLLEGSDGGRRVSTQQRSADRRSGHFAQDRPALGRPVRSLRDVTHPAQGTPSVVESEFATRGFEIRKILKIR